MLFQPRRTAVTFMSTLPNRDYSRTPGYNRTRRVTVSRFFSFFLFQRQNEIGLNPFLFLL